MPDLKSSSPVTPAKMTAAHAKTLDWIGREWLAVPEPEVSNVSRHFSEIHALISSIVSGDTGTFDKKRDAVVDRKIVEVIAGVVESDGHRELAATMRKWLVTPATQEEKR